MIDVDLELSMCSRSVCGTAEAQFKRLVELLRQVAQEREVILDYAVKTCQELVREQDGIDLGYNENKRLILETLKLEADNGCK